MNDFLAPDTQNYHYRTFRTQNVNIYIYINNNKYII